LKLKITAALSTDYCYCDNNNNNILFKEGESKRSVRTEYDRKTEIVKWLLCLATTKSLLAEKIGSCSLG
jgi:hypothetical protein